MTYAQLDFVSASPSRFSCFSCSDIHFSKDAMTTREKTFTVAVFASAIILTVLLFVWLTASERACGDLFPGNRTLSEICVIANP